MPVYFEHHVVLWKDPTLQIGMRGKGGFKRMLAGLPVFQTEAHGPGEIAFSRDDAGHVFPLHLTPGSSVLVREHQYLAASGSLDYTYQRIKGFANMMVGNSGFFVDQFTAAHQGGVLWLHGYGNVFEKVLAPGEQIDIEPGGWIYRDGSVQMEQTVYGLRTGIFGGQGNLVWNRFSGPGRVGIQSMYVHYPTEE